jgi:hypothetical protein
MFTLFFSPPDIMFIGVSAHLDNRSRHIVRSTLLTSLPFRPPRRPPRRNRLRLQWRPKTI